MPADIELSESQREKQLLLSGESTNVTFDLPETLLPSLSHRDFFSFSSMVFLVGNKLGFLGYAAAYSLHFFRPETLDSKLVLFYLCGWNYFEFARRSVAHCNNLIELFFRMRRKKDWLCLNLAEIAFSFLLVMGTTTALLSGLEIIPSYFKVLSTLTPAFCTIFLTLIESRQAIDHARLLPTENLKRHLSKLKLRSALSSREQTDKAHDVSELQLFALEGYAQQKKGSEDGIVLDPSQYNLVKFLKTYSRVNARKHALSALFWLIAGVGFIFTSFNIFLFQPLLIPEAILFFMAAVIKLVDVFEADLRLLKCCGSAKTFQLGDDPLTNAVALLSAKRNFLRSYHHDLSNVPREINCCCRISKGDRKKMHMAWEIFSADKTQVVDESAFYAYLLSLNGHKRSTVLENALKISMENAAMNHRNLPRNSLFEPQRKFLLEVESRADFSACCRVRERVSSMGVY